MWAFKEHFCRILDFFAPAFLVNNQSELLCNSGLAQLQLCKPPMVIPINLLERMTTIGGVYLLRSDEGEGEPLVPCPACTADSVHGVHRGRRQGDLLQKEKNR